MKPMTKIALSNAKALEAFDIELGMFTLNFLV